MSLVRGEEGFRVVIPLARPPSAGQRQQQVSIAHTAGCSAVLPEQLPGLEH